MTFADKTDKASTGRFTLVRVTPARCIDSYLASVGGGVYQMTWTRPVAALTRNGVALTQVGALSAVDQFTYDEGTQILQVQLASAPSDASNVLVLFYYLFYASGMAVLATQDPLDSSTPLRQWTPRVLTEPQLSQTVRNVTQGVFTVADTSLELANADRALNQFFGPADSFKDKDIDCWIGIREGSFETPLYQRAYKGKVNAASLAAESVELQIYDAFSRLTQPAYMGDAPGMCVVQLTSDSFPSADPNKVGQVLPYFIGRFSRYKTVKRATFVIEWDLDITSMPEAFCSNYNDTTASSVNRSWVLGRVSADGLRGFTLPSPSNVTVIADSIWVAGTGTTEAYSASIWGYTSGVWATMSDVTAGDRIKISDGTKTDYGYIAARDEAGMSVTIVWVSANGAGATTITGFSDPALVLVDEAGNEYQLAPERDYTTTLTTLPSGNKLVSVTFVNNFEGNLTKLNGYPGTFTGFVNPQRHKVFFRLRPQVTNYAKHGHVLSQIMTLVGLSPVAATFTAANTALPVNLAVQIPYFDESSYKGYIDYAEDILASTLGILALDSSSQVQYALIAAPSASDGTDDNYVLGDQSLQIAVDYNDVVTGLIAYNPHNSSQAAIQGTPSPSETRYNLLAQYLHGISNAFQFRHVLETITGRIDQILAARSNRRATFTFGVATRYLTAKIGDDCQLQTKFLLGSDTARSVKITSLDKSADRVTVSAIDLLGVT